LNIGDATGSYFVIVTNTLPLRESWSGVVKITTPTFGGVMPKSLNFANTSSFQTQDGTQREMKSSEAWTLTDGGKTLTINTTRTGREGQEVKMKRVYDKK
jgi:hypothetical protein